MRRTSLLFGVVFLFAGCASEPPAERPVRSPTVDYPAPPPQTSDGRVVGADEVAPADKLAEGATNQGPAPGWSADTEKGEVKYNPKKRVGGATDADEKADSEVQPKPSTP